jgi:hypothetical protein
VDPFGLNACRAERSRQTIGPVLRSGENECILNLAAFQQRDEQKRFQMLRDG